MLIEPTAPISNLLDRAQDGIGRQDWKFALDCLQRVIDDPEGSLIARDGGNGQWTLYETARRYATRQLSLLPPEGLRAYRLLYDGKAKRLFELGKQAEDSSELRAIVNRFLLTSYGDDAADLLASRALDAGNAGEVISILTDVIQLVPDRDIPEALIAAKLAAAYALQGRLDQSSVILETFRAGKGNRTTDSLSEIIPSVEALSGLSPRLFQSDANPISWPMVGGALDRRSRMAKVVPSIVHDVPWRFDLEGSGSDAWRRVFADDPATALWLPALHPVASDGFLFVRTPKGCVALNMEDLSPHWQATEPGLEFSIGRTTGDAQLTRKMPRLHKLIGAERVDYLSAGIAVGPGVILTVSRNGSAAYLHADSDAVESNAAPGVAQAVTKTKASGTRILAYDIATGSLRWQRGRTGDPLDPLGSVAFQALPLAIGDQLWVSFFRRNDLNLAILDANDGSLIHQLLLCSIRGALPSTESELSLASANGLVYVPSGYGVLFAVDAKDHTLRWGTQFASAADLRPTFGRSGLRSWLPSPPIATGGMVVIAPTESDPLVALSGDTGVPQWLREYGDNRYLIAADADSLWIGGRSIERIALSNGDVIWSAAIPSSLTGRAVLSGDILHVPVLDGLITLDASSGEALAYVESSTAEEPLGNLLCLDAAMFSVGPSGIRKYPDIKQSYARTRAAYKTDPTNAVTATRLAWLELLKGQSKQAQDVLESIPASVYEQNTRIGDQATHVRVEVLLKLAKGMAADPSAIAESVRLLELARQSAKRPEDELRCELAIGEALDSAGRHEEAFRRLWRLGASELAKQSFRLGDQVIGSVRFDIARRLDRITQNLTVQQAGVLQESLYERTQLAIQQLSDDSTSASSTGYLEAAAQMATKTVDGQRAMLALAKFHIGRGRHERAESYLRRVIASAADPNLTLTGLHELCSLYLAESYAGADATGLLLQYLDSLDSRFGNELVPIEFETSRSNRMSRPTLVKTWTKKQRRRVGAARLASYNDVNAATLLQIAETPIWSVKWNASPSANLVSFGDTIPRVLAEHIILHNANDVLVCHNAFDGSLVWEADLHRPETFSSLEDNNTRLGPQRKRNAVADGQIGVFASQDGLFAVGLVTGRRLWFKPFELAGEIRTPLRRDLTMAAGDGLLAAMPKAGRLTLVRMHDGTTVWERDLRAEPVDRVWMFGNRIVTSDERNERVNIIDRNDGSLVKRFQFEQPDQDGGFLALVETAGILCGPMSNREGDSIIGIDLSDGKPVWRVELDKPPVQIFSPQEGHVAVSLFGGDIRIVDVQSGEVMPNRHVSRTHKILDGVLINGTLLLQHVATRDKVKTAKLTAIDIVTGAELWQRDDIVSLSLAHDPLQTIGGCVPAVVLPPRDAPRTRKRFITMIDVRTGENVGKPVSPAPLRTASHVSGDFVILPVSKVLVVGTRSGVYALPLEPPATQSNEGL